MLDFKDRVAIVTGAGNGLGKVYALALAACGCKVVVNDLGGSTKGDGSNAKIADDVVNEIKSKGGIATPNYDSVADGEKIVETAIKTFGRLDIVINNAGILRDVSFHKMKEKDWDLLNLVHLKGSYKVTAAAWPYFRSQKYGRVVFITSAAGLYGNFGQAGYSAVKMGIVGLCNTLALEGKKYNIVCNTVAPVAASRMTKTVLPPPMLKQLKPAFVSPLVEYLVHESCKTSGGVYETGAGWVAQVRLERSKGVIFREMTAEKVGKQIAKIRDFTAGSSHPTKINETFGPVSQAINERKKPPPKKNKHVDYDKAVGTKFKPFDYTYQKKDLILYALGIGASREERRFVYENDSKFQAIPSFGVIPAFKMMSALIGGVPGLKFNPMMLLHGEQKLEVVKKIPKSGTLTNTGFVKEIYDKGKKGATVLLETESRDSKGDVVFRNLSTVFIRGIGGFGGDKGPAPPDFSPPKREPDAVFEQKISRDAAALYRLSGDFNPLHIDPRMAAMGGFKEPILHGLCSFGFSIRAVLKQYCNNDGSKFKSVQVRFSKHVFPGETLAVEMWKVPGGVIFQTIVRERNAVCLKNCKVELHEKKVAASSSQTTATKKTGSSFAAEKVFTEMGKRVTPDMVKKVGSVFRFDVTKGKEQKSWIVDLKSKGSVTKVAHDSKIQADCTISMEDADLVKMISGKLDAQTAFMQGQLKLSGDMMLATKLGVLMKGKSAL